MPSRIFPSEDERGPAPFQGNPRGSRIFRVVHRHIDEQTELRIADSAEDALADDAALITVLAREHAHEVVECTELLAQGTVWKSALERK